MNKSTHIILASASPRRQQLLKQIGITYTVRPADIDERQKLNEVPLVYCQRMATEKAQKIWGQSLGEQPVIGADTVVVQAGKCLGKPLSKTDAINMLQKLSGKIHQVISTVCLLTAEGEFSGFSTSDVEFSKIDGECIRQYVDTGEPMDKAGSYAIQGKAAMWIKSINGSYSGIMGLPLFETTQMLCNAGIIECFNGC